MRILAFLFAALTIALVVGVGPPARAQLAAHEHTPAVLEALSGTYRTTLVLDDLLAQDFDVPYDLVGIWTLTIRIDGIVEWHYDMPSGPGPSSYDMSGVYVVHDQRLYFGAESGDYPCQDLYGVTSGVYTWSWRDDGALDLAVVEDDCSERRIILTAHPLQSPRDGTTTP